MQITPDSHPIGRAASHIRGGKAVSEMGRASGSVEGIKRGGREGEKQDWPPALQSSEQALRGQAQHAEPGQHRPQHQHARMHRDGHHADTRLACWGAAGSVLIWRYVTKVRGFVGEYADATEGPGSQLQHLCQEHGRQIRGTAALQQALSDRKSNSALLVPGYSQLAQGSTYSEATSAYAKVEGMGGISFLVPPRSLSSPGSIQQQQHRAPCPAAT